MRLHVAALFLAATILSVPCMAGDTIPFPPLEEGEWTISTTGVLNNGERFGTPESAIACIHPTRKMQEDLDAMQKKGCAVQTTAVANGTVRYTVTCSGKGGDQLMNATLTAPDAHSFRQVITTSQGTNALQGRRLGPCKHDADGLRKAT